MVSKGIVALSGARGFIGARVAEALKEHGYEVWPLVRERKGGPAEIFYDYHRKIIDRERLVQCSAVIHLAGKNIGSGWWTSKLRRELWESRVASTKLIAGAMAEFSQGPQLLICASAVGFYGDGGNEELDERAPLGMGFLAELCEAWEQAAKVAQATGIRVVNLRLAPVVGPGGGMLKGLEGLFKMGLGAVLGSGRQYMPVVALDDVVAATLFALENPELAGPVNVVCPQAVTNEEFTRQLAKALKRPTWLKVPPWALRLLGEPGRMALGSCRAVPKALLEAGFCFGYPNVREILKKVYG